MIDEKHRYLFRGTDPAYMTGDIAMIKQSIRIFVQNAAKYSSDGADITLGVMLESGYVSYMIQDEGIGMESSDVVHIFERFHSQMDRRCSLRHDPGRIPSGDRHPIYCPFPDV